VVSRRWTAVGQEDAEMESWERWYPWTLAITEPGRKIRTASSVRDLLGLRTSTQGFCIVRVVQQKFEATLMRSCRFDENEPLYLTRNASLLTWYTARLLQHQFES